MRILVTGGSGFIGRHVVAALQGEGRDAVRARVCGFRPGVTLLEGFRTAWADFAPPTAH